MSSGTSVRRREAYGNSEMVLAEREICSRWLWSKAIATYLAMLSRGPAFGVADPRIVTCQDVSNSP